METGNSCALFPLVRMEDGTYSINDGVLRDIWAKLVASGKDKSLFWGGSVQTAAQFIDWLKMPFNYPVLVIDTDLEQVAFIAWLNNYADKSAMGHFASVGEFNLEHMKTVMRYWSGMMDAAGNPLIHVVIGFVPTVNARAIRAMHNSGMTVIGEIPDAVTVLDGSRSGATIGYFETKDWR